MNKARLLKLMDKIQVDFKLVLFDMTIQMWN